MPHSVIINNEIFTSGDSVTCYIENNFIENARICVTGDGAGSVFICQDQYAGNRSPDMLGFRYSWVFHIRNGLGDNNCGVSDVRKIPVGQRKLSLKISADLDRFFKIYHLYPINSIISAKCGVFDEFDEFNLSTNSGMILLSSSETSKKMEVKFGRFFRKIIEKYNEFCILKFEITDQIVEKTHNNYVSYQKDGSLPIEFLSGESILEGYNRENYILEPVSSLHKSCMVGQKNFLKIYTENPNQIQLAIIKIDNKISARTLIWTLENGEKYHDRIYYSFDWLENYVSDKLKESGISFIQKLEVSKTVKLDKLKFDKYPYLDSFYHFDESSSSLHFNRADMGLPMLRMTNGDMYHPFSPTVDPLTILIDPEPEAVV